MALTGITISVTSNLSCRRKAPVINITDVERNSSLAHLLRENKIQNTQPEEKYKTVIIGGGASGLSAARTLSLNSMNNYLLLELGSQFGGNSVGGKNKVSRFPWAAHYLPIPNLNNKELIRFLQECKVIIDIDGDGMPVYDEEYLCHVPHERLFIGNRWQNGLVPEFGVPADEKNEIIRFTNLVEELKEKKDENGRFWFDIPLELSSRESILQFDKISFAEFLKKNNFTSEHLLWHLNYCCKDDFGAGIDKVSAFAGLHYFASRRGKAGNAELNAVLTWPQGNEFLIEQLLNDCKGEMKSSCLVTCVSKNNGNYIIEYYDSSVKKYKAVTAGTVICCTPSYINKRIFKGISDSYSLKPELFHYYPWLIANITLDKKFFDVDDQICWDNVFYGSESLGYVNACHQVPRMHSEQLVVTYYHALCNQSAKEERINARNKTAEEWKVFILNQFKKAHPAFEESILDIEYKLLGHGMICPSPGLLTFLQETQKQEESGLAYAHTDKRGISIFEEAFFAGNRAAEKILKQLNENA